MQLLLFILCLIIAHIKAEWMYHYPIHNVDLLSDSTLMEYKMFMYGRLVTHLTKIYEVENSYSGVRVSIYKNESTLIVKFDVASTLGSMCNETFLGRPNILGHDFLKLYRTVRYSVKDETLAMITKYRLPVITIGGGVGGALAQILMADLLSDLAGTMREVFLQGVIMLDTPMVGSHEFSKMVCSRVECIRMGPIKDNRKLGYDISQHERVM